MKKTLIYIAYVCVAIAAPLIAWQMVHAENLVNKLVIYEDVYSSGFDSIRRLEDDNGVVCYLYRGYNKGGISCLKTTD